MRSAFFLSVLLLFTGFSSIAGNRAISSSDAVCLACDIPGGLVVTNITDSSATLNWDAATGATQYTVGIEDEQNNPSTFHIETSVTGTSYQVSGLKAGVKYKFKVRTRCGGDKSDWSEWVFFVAGNSNSGNNGGNSAGSCSIPSGLSSTVNGSTVILSWNADSTATKYTIEVEDEQNNPSTFQLKDSTTSNSYTLTGLQTGVLYKFKVRKHCSGGQSDWSAWLFFNATTGGNSNGGNSSGNCSAPKNAKVTDITSTTVLLTWDTVPGATSYLLEIERNTPGNSPWKITQSVITNSFSLTSLDPNRRYKFKVRTNCSGGGHSDWSKWVKFQTASNFTSTSTKVSQVTFRSADTKEDVAAFDAQIGPNPAQTMTTVRLTGLSAEPVLLRLLDLSGRVVREQSTHPDSESIAIRLTLEDMPDGLYLLHVSNGQQSRMLKLIVSR